MPDAPDRESKRERERELELDDKLNRSCPIGIVHLHVGDSLA